MDERTKKSIKKKKINFRDYSPYQKMELSDEEKADIDQNYTTEKILERLKKFEMLPEFYQLSSSNITFNVLHFS